MKYTHGGSEVEGSHNGGAGNGEGLGQKLLLLLLAASGFLVSYTLVTLYYASTGANPGQQFTDLTSFEPMHDFTARHEKVGTLDLACLGQRGVGIGAAVALWRQYYC